MPEESLWLRPRAAAALSLLLVLKALPAAAAPAAQAVLRLDGRLTDASQAPLAGNYLLRFGIWDAPREGSEVWSESLYVSAKDGFYTALLGRLKPLPTTVMDSAYRLEVSAPPGTGWLSQSLKAPTLSRDAPAEPQFTPDPGLRVESDPIQTSAPVPAPSPVRTHRPAPAAPTASSSVVVLPDAAALAKELAAVKEELDRRKTAGFETRIYQVLAGDTLRSVAVKLYGDAERWIDLYQANDDRISRGGELIAGQRLLVPREGAIKR